MVTKGDASEALVEMSQAESASTQELSAISENLLETSAGIMEKSEQSKENLVHLEDSSHKMKMKMQDVDHISRKPWTLMEISQTESIPRMRNFPILPAWYKVTAKMSLFCPSR